MKSPWIDQKSAPASASSSWDSPDSSWSSLLKSSLLTVGSRVRVGSRKSLSLPDNFAVPSAAGNMNSSPFCVIKTSFALILRGWISDASKFAKSSKSAIRIFPFQIPPAISSKPRKIPGKTVFPNWWSLDWSLADIGWYHGRFADSNSIPQNHPTTFHPIPIAAILLKYLLSHVVQLFQQCHLSRIDEVLKFDDAMIDLYKICQTPVNCQYQWLLFFFRRLEELWKTFVRLIWSLCFARIGLNPLSGKILNNDSVPVIVSWFTSLIEDFVISRYTSPNFSARGTVSPVRLLVRKQTWQFRFFVEVSINTVLPWCWYHFRRTFRIWVLRNVCGCWYFCVL